jgi:DNA-binding Lrp family transcriptional regulator
MARIRISAFTSVISPESGILLVLMQESSQPLDEEDLALIHALQLAPRAPWSELGRALAVDPVTAARRWNKLSSRGEAWVTVSPGPRVYDALCIAYIDIACATGRTHHVAGQLAHHPNMVTIERCTDAHTLLATVATANIAAMSRYTLDVLPAVSDVTAVRARIVTHMFTEGGRWRIDALGPSQRAELRQPAPAPKTRADHSSAPDPMLFELLSRDGRASHQTLATALGVSPRTVKRRLDTLMRAGVLRFRCDFARPLGGYPIAVTFWAAAPAHDLADIGRSVIQHRHTRNCAAISGQHNLIIQANMTTTHDVLAFEHHLATSHPSLRINERTITLRHHKMLGHILDADGRSTATIPPYPWCDLPADL